MRLRHASLVSSSQANADKFYEGLLKLKKIKTSTLTSNLAVKISGIDVECPFILYENEDFAVEVFVTNQIPDKKSPFAHLCLEVDNRERFLKSCRSHGLKVNLVPRGDSQICFVQDFDGNLFEIKQGAT